MLLNIFLVACAETSENFKIKLLVMIIGLPIYYYLYNIAKNMWIIIDLC